MEYSEQHLGPLKTAIYTYNQLSAFVQSGGGGGLLLLGLFHLNPGVLAQLRWAEQGPMVWKGHHAVALVHARLEQRGESASLSYRDALKDSTRPVETEEEPRCGGL